LVYAFERRSANDIGMLGRWGMDAEDVYMKRAERVSL